MSLSLFDLRTERQSNPLGLGEPAPRFSWKLQAERRGVMQSAYQVQVVTGHDNFGATLGLLWNTGKVNSSRSIEVAYAGAVLCSRQLCRWRVRAWDDEGEESPWSEPAAFEMGLLARSDWTACWISPPVELAPSVSTPAPMLRREFKLSKPIARARVYATSLGLYELHLNGVRVGDQLFAPGWTSYAKRLQYQVYDVTTLLNSGENAFGVMLGDGWHRLQPFNWDGLCNNGKPFALLLQLEVEYADGATETINTDEFWKFSQGPILRSEIYGGETYDARLEQTGWTDPRFDDAQWRAVEELASPMASGEPALIATQGPMVRRMEELTPVKITKTASGAHIVDMGQNMVGSVRLRAKGARGTEISLRHAEVLDGDGAIYTAPLRTAKQHVVYILAGCGEEVFEPHFTFQGFRYVEIENYPGELTPEHVIGIVVHSDMASTGEFETSDPLINQLQHNIVWSLKGNFLEVPTDCPQRNERLGWGFDAQLFAPTAAFNKDVSSFFAKWLGDWSADQLADGSLPMESPRANHRKYVLRELLAHAGRQDGDERLVEFTGVPGYGDAAVIVPWLLYQTYGDARVLETSYPTMTRWVDYVGSQAEDHIWDPMLSLGDWLDFSTTQSTSWFGANALDVMATSFYANSVSIVARAANVLGKHEESEAYWKLHAAIAGAFLKKFVSDDGRVGQGMQVDYVLALDFDLLPIEMRAPAARYLVEDIRQRGHLTTGIGGSQHVLQVLSRFGYLDESYTLLKREEMPSWLYSVANGATTIWERWDGIRPDGSFQDPNMNSFNHFAFGAVGQWMYETIGGLAPDNAAPGYANIVVQPKPGGGINHAKARYQTPYGEASTSWVIEANKFQLAVVVPPNSTATVTLANTTPDRVLESGAPLEGTVGLRSFDRRGDDVVVVVGSGRYAFEATVRP